MQETLKNVHGVQDENARKWSKIAHFIGVEVIYTRMVRAMCH